MALAHTGRAEKQHVLLLSNESAGWQAPRDRPRSTRGWNVQVEAFQRLAGGKARELEQSGHAPLRLPFDFALEDEIQEASWEIIVSRPFFHQLGEALGRMRQTERGTLLHDLIEIDFRVRGSSVRLHELHVPVERPMHTLGNAHGAGAGKKSGQLQPTADTQGRRSDHAIGRVAFIVQRIEEERLPGVTRWRAISWPSPRMTTQRSVPMISTLRPTHAEGTL